jgi:hypothetical protein
MSRLLLWNSKVAVLGEVLQGMNVRITSKNGTVVSFEILGGRELKGSAEFQEHFKNVAAAM